MDLDKVIEELVSRLGDIVSNYEEAIAKLKVRAQAEVDRLTDENEAYVKKVATLSDENAALTRRLAEGQDVQEEVATDA
jgi:hypothetical protein